MTLSRWIIVCIIIATLLIAFIWWQFVSATAPEPSYRLLKKDGRFEIRKYPNLIIAEVEAQGERKPAINEGFRILARYIYGQNRNKAQIAMTAPVLQTSDHKLLLNSEPFENNQSETWTIGFIMPVHFDMENLPKPIDQRIKVKYKTSQKYAVIRFSGLASDRNLQKNLTKLQDFIKREGLQVKDETPLFAFYNPPWIVPFLRRNEILIEVQ